MNNLITVTIDRPIGFIDSFGNQYPINYGFIAGVLGGDGEEQDAYIITRTVDSPLKTFEGVLLAIIKRKDDNEDKWVVSTTKERYSISEIAEKVHFIEQYFDSEIILISSD
ncbi:inorganic diphosphatase [Enterococcus sp.]|uniref:inorganic diphosphatase n=1 Tax=Enterococcus sp. TaxID=35783 RepID=UPI003FA56BFD